MIVNGITIPPGTYRDYPRGTGVTILNPVQIIPELIPEPIEITIIGLRLHADSLISFHDGTHVAPITSCIPAIDGQSAVIQADLTGFLEESQGWIQCTYDDKDDPLRGIIPISIAALPPQSINEGQSLLATISSFTWVDVYGQYLIDVASGHLVQGALDNPVLDITISNNNTKIHCRLDGSNMTDGPALLTFYDSLDDPILATVDVTMQ